MNFEVYFALESYSRIVALVSFVPDLRSFRSEVMELEASLLFFPAQCASLPSVFYI